VWRAERRGPGRVTDVPDNVLKARFCPPDLAVGQTFRVKALGEAFFQLSKLVKYNSPHCRERSNSFARLEEAFAWAEKAIAQELAPDGGSLTADAEPDRP